MSQDQIYAQLVKLFLFNLGKKASEAKLSDDAYGDGHFLKQYVLQSSIMVNLGLRTNHIEINHKKLEVMI